MSWSSRKGHEGEAGVRDYINLWFPNHEMGGAGAKIIPSEGSNDRGDIDGVPYTCIEVKNHADPQVGSLVANAEWKAGNSKRPIWFLTYKRNGASPTRAFLWHTLTTVDGFINGFLPVSGTDAPAFTPEQVEDLCWSDTNMMVQLTARYPGTEAEPKFKWHALLMFRSYAAGSKGVTLEQKRDRTIEEAGWSIDDLPTSNLVVPVVIYPRIGYVPGSWYVYTTLQGEVRMLESVGLIPQDISEYADQNNVAV